VSKAKPSGHILIIDDEVSLRQTLARILQRAGFDVSTAANGKEGITLADENSFDLIYLDIRMPDINGLDVLKIIHTDHPDVPIILFTAQPDLHSAVEALRRGASDYLLKPLRPQVVIDRTNSILADQQKKKRKNELQRQMDALQAEIHSLEKDPSIVREPATGPISSQADGRHFIRGTLTLDTHTRRATMNKKAVELSPTSFDYLLVLARHAPNVVDYQTLVAEAQGYESNVREAQELTKWHVHHIRQAMEVNPRKPAHVINVRGKGYRLVVD
jgi:DNA-binding response OmpR family regulator